jgi:hypothetical protein
MFQYGIGYRFSNGEVEGIMGYGFTKESSQRDAIQQVINKLNSFQVREVFNHTRVIDNSDNGTFTSQELEQIKTDWKCKTVRY